MESGPAPHPTSTGGATIVLRTLVEENDWARLRTVRRAALADAPYAFSSTLREWSDAGDTEARWRNRLTSVPFNVVAELEDDPVGMVSCTAPEDGEVDLMSMWVAPSVRGRGVGDALIAAVIDEARRGGAQQVALAVREANRHAVALYARNGFVDDGPWEDCPPGPAHERRMVRILGSP
jgi:ribosomal protein S18 acetylase RimI-like enzyme